MTSFEETKQRHVEDLIGRFPHMLEPLGWNGDRLAAARESQLRALVAHASERSAWHRHRLASVDPSTVTETDLAKLPTMSKADVMAHFDDIVTDRRITLDVAEEHLAGLDTGPAYLFDEYQVVATGGSSGARTIMVWDWNGWMDCFLSLCRYQLSRDAGQLGGGPIAGVAGDHPSHMSAALQTTFSNPLIDMHRIHAASPIEDIVGQLNEIQPETLLAYASIAHRLALEAEAGRLKISPRKVMSASEALLPETRALIHEVWGVELDNSYAASETGCLAHSCGRGPWMHLSDDTLIVEVEDDRVLVTNLVNKVMPLIRYELDDRAKLLDVDCPCGSAHRVIGDVDGRRDDTFHFSGGRAVHPIVFSTELGRHRAVAEYQVRQRGDAVDIDLVSAGELDVSVLAGLVVQSLERAGAPGIEVTVTEVPVIARHGSTAKLRRYIPCHA